MGTKPALVQNLVPQKSLVRQHEPMNESQFRRRFIAGVILCVVLAFLIGRITSFEPLWRGLKDGMTESEVKRALGPPTWIGTSGCIGAGGKDVIRWDYERSELGVEYITMLTST